MINPAKPEIKAARPRTYTTLWDTILMCSDHYGWAPTMRYSFALEFIRWLREERQIFAAASTSSRPN
jgi:hypothetical protein